MDDVRLIDANALESLIAKQAGECKIRVFDPSVNLILQNIRNAPTIDAQPVKRGKWIAVTSYDAFGGDAVQWEIHGNPIAYHYCSECKDQCDVDENGNEILSDFCRNCGADMRGDE